MTFVVVIFKFFTTHVSIGLKTIHLGLCFRWLGFIFVEFRTVGATDKRVNMRRGALLGPGWDAPVSSALKNRLVIVNNFVPSWQETPLCNGLHSASCSA